jgi:hypothetical protein
MLTIYGRALRTILKLVLEIPISKINFVVSGSSQYLKLIPMPQTLFKVTPAVWWALGWGLPAFKKSPTYAWCLKI